MSYQRWDPEKARGRWRGILSGIGMGEEYLRDRHGPCPFCQGGTDRYRFDDKNGEGTSICSQCGARSGMQAVQDFLGIEFLAAKDRVLEVLGEGVKRIEPKPGLSEEDEKRIRLKVWSSGRPIEPGDVADAYLHSRGLAVRSRTKVLRVTDAARHKDGSVFPAMLAAVMDPEGVCVSVHKTFLEKNGNGKAAIADPRALTPGKLPDGVAVRLFEAGPVMGVAEGIETALAASALFGMPVWACLNAAMLVKWTPPEVCREVAVFADNDDNFTGQAAAYALARKITLKGRTASVHVPAETGTDWLDQYNTKNRKDAA